MSSKTTRPTTVEIPAAGLHKIATTRNSRKIKGWIRPILTIMNRYVAVFSEKKPIRRTGPR